MRYIANPVEVDAFRIITIGTTSGHDGSTALELDNGKWVEATRDMTSRMTPLVGDYWVIQSDGYIYLNPKAVFERKYRPLGS